MRTGGSQCVVDGQTHYQRNKQQYMDRVKQRQSDMNLSLRSLKSAVGCVDCGNKDWRVLDYDHLPEFTKSIGISKAVGLGWSLIRIMEEIKKCEVVCSNCHRIRTLTRAGIA